MKTAVLVVFIFSLASALVIGFEHFSKEIPITAGRNPFPKNSIEEKVFLDFSDLKRRKQLPSEIYDASGIFVSDQRSNKSEKLSREIVTALKSVADLRGDGLYEIELVVFDTASVKDPRNKKNRASENVEANKAIELIFQFSIIEKKTKNKVAEFGRTYFTK